MLILTSSRPLCLYPIKISSSRAVTHLLPHLFPQSLPQAVNRISHSFISAPQKKAAVSSFLLSTNPIQTLMVPLPSVVLIRGNWPSASLSCCSLYLAPLFCLFPLESLHLLVSFKVGSAWQQQKDTAGLWSHLRIFSSLSLPKICSFTKSFFICEAILGVKKVWMLQCYSQLAFEVQELQYKFRTLPSCQ